MVKQESQSWKLSDFFKGMFKIIFWFIIIWIFLIFLGSFDNSSEINSLERKINSLESEVGSLRSNIRYLQDDVSDLEIELKKQNSITNAVYGY